MNIAYDIHCINRRQQAAREYLNRKAAEKRRKRVVLALCVALAAFGGVTAYRAAEKLQADIQAMQ